MKQIWKYPITPNTSTTMSMPAGAKILSVHEQHGYVCMWALVEPKNELENRSFEVFGTGHDIVDIDMDYLGMASLDGGSLIFHVFEVK